MKTRALTTSMIFATLFSLSPAAFAHDGHNHGEHAQPGKTAATPLATGQGVVKKIDLPNQRLTLAHDPIAQLNWPAMTMPFAVTDKALLNGLKVGDRVEFDLRDEGTIGALRASEAR